jgi:protein-arginine kinase activator protein McsA
MITGFHQREKDYSFFCYNCKKEPATISLHIEWKPGEPFNFDLGSQYERYYCQPCAEKIIREQDKGWVR